MAKGHKSLIRLNEWKVDENRRILSQKLADVAATEDAITALEEEVVLEQTTAEQAPQEAGLFYGVYANGVIVRREEYKAELEQKESHVLVAQDVLNKSYRELEKFKILRKEREKREKKERDKEEQGMLDELGLQSFQKSSD